VIVPRPGTRLDTRFDGVPKKHYEPRGATACQASNARSASCAPSRTPRRLANFAMNGTFAEDRLPASEERFRQLLNFAPAFVSFYSPDGAVTFANERWFDFSGVAPDGDPA
jgi:PAS domain-containing protein